MPKSKRKTTVLLAAVLLILALPLYTLVSAGHGQRVNFQEYKPSYLPSGLATTDGEFNVLRTKKLFPSFNKHINVYFSAPNSWIAEWKSDGHPTNICSDFADHRTCDTYTTKHGQQYQLSVNTDSNTGLPIYSIRFIKHGTEIRIGVRDFNKNISVAEWSKVVDSFQPGHYDGLKTRHGSASGP